MPLVIRDYIIGWLKKWVAQWLFKKIIGGAIGGVYGWIFNIAFNYGWKKLIKPGLQWLGRKVNSFFKRREYKKKAEALNDSKTEADFDSASDDIP